MRGGIYLSLFLYDLMKISFYGPNVNLLTVMSPLYHCSGYV